MSTGNITETHQYLTFSLADEEYAVDVIQVNSVLDSSKITKLPNTPDYMRGVINLRGAVVPIIDLRMKFGMSKTEETVDTSIIVLEINYHGETVTAGAMADSVQEVIELSPENIEDVPKIGLKLKHEFVKGMGKRDDSFIIILDIDKIFSAEDMTELFQETKKEEAQKTAKNNSPEE